MRPFGLPQLVEIFMIRHDHMGQLRDLQPAFDLNASFLQVIDLLKQYYGIDDYAVTDTADLTLVQDAGRQEMKNIFLFSGDNGVSRVVTTLVTYDKIYLAGQDIDDLALTLISPLRSY
jgi:hypothetical protein